MPKSAMTIRLPPDLDDFLTASADREGRSKNNLLTQWVREKVDAASKPLRARPDMRAAR